jgi:CTP synthase (UTP-ammonia lyase)
MQCAVVEFARMSFIMMVPFNEINHKTKYPVIDLMEEQKSIWTRGNNETGWI